MIYRWRSLYESGTTLVQSSFPTKVLCFVTSDEAIATPPIVYLLHFLGTPQVFQYVDARILLASHHMCAVVNALPIVLGIPKTNPIRMYLLVFSSRLSWEKFTDPYVYSLVQHFTKFYILYQDFYT